MRVEAWVVPSTGVGRDVLERRELEFGESRVGVGEIFISQNFLQIFFSNIFFSKFFGIEVGNPGVVSVGVGVSSTLGAT